MDRLPQSGDNDTESQKQKNILVQGNKSILKTILYAAVKQDDW